MKKFFRRVIEVIKNFIGREADPKRKDAVQEAALVLLALLVLLFVGLIRQHFPMPPK